MRITTRRWHYSDDEHFDSWIVQYGVLDIGHVEAYVEPTAKYGVEYTAFIGVGRKVEPILGTFPTKVKAVQAVVALHEQRTQHYLFEVI